MNISQLKNIAIAELIELEEDYVELVKSTKKRKKSKLEKEYGVEFLSISTLFKKEISKKRKDRKFASIVVEMYAIIEQLMLNIYVHLEGKEFDKDKIESDSHKSKNTIVLIEKELDKVIKTDNVLKVFAQLRNKIVHKQYSLQYARSVVNGSASKNKKQIEELFILSRRYIDSIKELK
ncbi:hypothetical protein [Niallia endozanthoxylica]|uniref:Cthe-2314-like HEPN domain-containing protein n=1 Tax=Niallia endozanthoxylica TaxID=2036016 RepID=A0A5J5I5F1_9BACI|nr:hypothetical protein [Niallia endozanthoxylica]KAA9029447.1 hypothetical protein F4V44_03120 [Niallia endozanthoxylica]